MKKFERLPAEKRKEEIAIAAISLFVEKGFAATTMENIVEKVSLSKGGVYRLYPSTAAILSDIILSGMHMRNAYYEMCILKLKEKKRELSLNFIIEMIVDSLLIYPDISKVYVEFLLAKRRNKELQKLYDEICEKSIKDTVALIEKYGANKILLESETTLKRLTEIMNGAVLSVHVLNLEEPFSLNKEKLCKAIEEILKI